MGEAAPAGSPAGDPPGRSPHQDAAGPGAAAGLAAPARRRLVRGAGVLLLAGLAAAFHAMVTRTGALVSRPRRVILPPERLQPVTFADGVIVVQAPSGRVRAFAARCTHLGCEISREVDGILVCPCHGSRFGLDGTVAGGPAAAPLQELACHTDPVTHGVIIDVS